MGLAGPKRRNKIGSDPNNTKWSKATDRFGHKILTAQGWKPGDTLGQADASHASHYTAGSTSHIRVMLREDNLGLGAQNGRQDTDTFGLDMFQGLLGRLNGKSEEILEREEGFRRDLRLKEAVVKKFGGITFVSAGHLIGDKIERDISEILPEVNGNPGTLAASKVHNKPESSKKRKRNGELPTEVQSLKKSKATGATEGDGQSEADKKKSKRDKGEKRQKKKGRKKIDTTSEETDGTEHAGSEPLAASKSAKQSPEELNEKEQKRQRKAQRRHEKEAKRLAKEEKKRRKSERHQTQDKRTDNEIATEAAPAVMEVSSTSETPREDVTRVVFAAVEKTPTIAGATTLRGRNLVRSRFQRSKRMAVTDEKALREIFMIKVQA